MVRNSYKNEVDMEDHYKNLHEKYGDYLTAKELAEYLRICENTAYRLLRKKYIKARRVGNNWRIPSVNIIKFLDNKV